MSESFEQGAVKRCYISSCICDESFCLRGSSAFLIVARFSACDLMVTIVLACGGLPAQCGACSRSHHCVPDYPRLHSCWFVGGPMTYVWRHFSFISNVPQGHNVVEVPTAISYLWVFQYLLSTLLCMSMCAFVQHYDFNKEFDMNRSVVFRGACRCDEIVLIPVNFRCTETARAKVERHIKGMTFR